MNKMTTDMGARGPVSVARWGRDRVSRPTRRAQRVTVPARTAFAALLAALLHFPDAARAQACAGTTVTANDDIVVNCEGGVTIVDKQDDTSGTPSGSGFLINAEGDVVVTGNARGADYGADLSIAQGATVTLNLTSSASGSTTDNRTTNGGIAALRAAGAGNLVVNISRDATAQAAEYARLAGEIDLRNLTGGVTVNVGDYGFWNMGRARGSRHSANITDGNDPTPGLVAFGDGDVTLNVLEGGHLAIRAYAAQGDGVSPSQVKNLVEQPVVVELGGGTNVVNNAGNLLVGSVRLQGSFSTAWGGVFSENEPARDNYEAEIRFEGLSTFNNSGNIWLGSGLPSTFGETSPPGTPYQQAVFGSAIQDYWPDDILSMPGATFVGLEGSRLWLDFDNTSVASQPGCSAALRNEAGDLPAADCLNLQDGATEGRTEVILNLLAPSARGLFRDESVVIVDVSGSGAGGAFGHFVIGAESTSYSPAFGGIVDGGFLGYAIGYDETEQTFEITSLPTAGAYHQSLLASAAQAAWRQSSGAWFDRQADLRDTLGGRSGPGGGVWVRTAFDEVEREVTQVYASPAGTDFAFDNRHDISSSAVTIGLDFLSGGEAARHWVVGGTLGYLRSDIDFANWTNTAYLNGMSIGAYGSLVDGARFVDVALNSTWSRMHQDMPQAELDPVTARLSGNVESLGLQAEAGWRFGERALSVEPLLSASWVSTSVDEMFLPDANPDGPGNTAQFDDTDSLRFGLGARGRFETMIGGLRLGASLMVRALQESEGEARVTILNPGQSNPEVQDAFDGTFTDVTGGLTLANSTGRVSGVLNIGTRSGDDYSATSASASFRYQW